jgi:uncharacterized membrane protein YfcA
MNAKDWLFVALTSFLAVYLVVFIRGVIDTNRRRQAAARGAETPLAPSLWQLAIGFVTNFFDTLGIGSFATTTAAYKLRQMVSVKLIPGTLNVGHTIPTIAQAFIYTRIVPVDSVTLVLMIAASVVGSWLGAGAVCRWPRRKIQVGMGLALLGAAALMLMTQLSLLPGGGDTLALGGVRLAGGLAGNFVLGMLMMLGIGLYAPCMILVSLLGMNPTAAFPIMMGSCAFLMPVSSIRFIRTEAFQPQAALGLAIGGLPAVLIAAYIVKSLPLAAVRWLVVAVVVYTAVNMLMTAREEEAVAG